MSQIHVEVSDTINARPEEIYNILADYRVGHPAIVPKAYFVELIVEQGGKGAGTVARVRMKVGGKEMSYHLIVSEPEPGRVLMETDMDTDLVTTFTVDPLNNGSATRLTIVTDFSANPGIKGFFEKLATPPVMRSIYKKELRQIADYVGSKNLSVSMN